MDKHWLAFLGLLSHHNTMQQIFRIYTFSCWNQFWKSSSSINFKLFNTQKKNLIAEYSSHKWNSKLQKWLIIVSCRRSFLVNFNNIVLFLSDFLNRNIYLMNYFRSHIKIISIFVAIVQTIIISYTHFDKNKINKKCSLHQAS